MVVLNKANKRWAAIERDIHECSDIQTNYVYMENSGRLIIDGDSSLAIRDGAINQLADLSFGGDLHTVLNKMPRTLRIKTMNCFLNRCRSIDNYKEFIFRVTKKNKSDILVAVLDQMKPRITNKNIIVDLKSSAIGYRPVFCKHGLGQIGLGVAIGTTVKDRKHEVSVGLHIYNNELVNSSLRIHPYVMFTDPPNDLVVVFIPNIMSSRISLKSATKIIKEHGDRLAALIVDDGPFSLDNMKRYFQADYPKLIDKLREKYGGSSGAATKRQVLSFLSEIYKENETIAITRRQLNIGALLLV